MVTPGGDLLQRDPAAIRSAFPGQGDHVGKCACARRHARGNRRGGRGDEVAALTFSGLGTEATLTAAKRELLVVLAGSSWRAAEEPAALFYDLPFTIPFLRRNEVVVRVAPTAP